MWRPRQNAARKTDDSSGRNPIGASANQSKRSEQRSVVSTDTIAQGNIATPGTVQLDGKLEGNVRAQRLIIGRHGSLTGDCRARDVEIAGEMTGELLCENLLIAETGGFEGTINCGRLAAESGCVVNATVQVSGSDELPEIPLLEGAGISIPGPFRTAIAEQQDRSTESQSTE